MSNYQNHETAVNGRATGPERKDDTGGADKQGDTGGADKRPAAESGIATVRKPVSTDGLGVNRLIAECPPLDTNSAYCNLLQCTHFAGTSAIADRGEEVVGFLSAYRPPDRPDVLFVWQVAVSPKARGQGLGKRLLRDVLSRPECREVRFLETSITPGNRASWNLFLSLAKERGCDYETETLFDSDRHFGGLHETEALLRIGPFPVAAVSS